MQSTLSTSSVLDVLYSNLDNDLVIISGTSKPNFDIDMELNVKLNNCKFRGPSQTANMEMIFK